MFQIQKIEGFRHIESLDFAIDMRRLASMPNTALIYAHIYINEDCGTPDSEPSIKLLNYYAQVCQVTMTEYHSRDIGGMMDVMVMNCAIVNVPTAYARLDLCTTIYANICNVDMTNFEIDMHVINKKEATEKIKSFLASIMQ